MRVFAMKLMFCPDCWDIFKLTTKEARECSCGKVKGKYLDNVRAVSNGEGFCLAIGNGSLQMAIQSMLWRKTNFPDADRHIYIEEAPAMCWVRPHEGPGNPHMLVDKKYFERVENA